MELFVNGGAVDAALEDEKTIGDVFRSFESYCEDNEAAVVGVTIDGAQVRPDAFDDAAKQPLKDNTKIDFEVITRERIDASFKSIACALNELIPHIEGISVSLQSAHVKDANDAVAKLSDCMANLSRTVTFITLFPQSYKEVISGDKSLPALFKEMNPILSDFADALKNGDTVTVGDLAEYEISPRLKTLSDILEGIHA